ncbi:MAG: fucose isomerase [Caldilineaceae bacterium]|nr:fucose isomerase [Caldilineaceae bacterium]
MNILEDKTTFGLIVGTRGFFNSELAVQGRRDLLAKLDALGYNYVIPPEDATPNGAIETYNDAKVCAELFKQHRDDIDGVIVMLPNFGDEMGVVYTLDMAKLGVPVLVQACDDEDPMKLTVKDRRDAFCGKFSVCNNLYQFGIPFTDTTYHTCAIDSAIFSHDLDSFARVCRVVKGLTHMRIGAIGARPTPFHTCRYSEKLLQSTGITVVTCDLSEMMAAAEKLRKGEAAAVAEKIAEIRDYGSIPSYIREEAIRKQAAWSVAVEQWMDNNDCQASAIQCWTSLQLNYGCATCLTMSMMGEKLMPSACEVDVTGAVSMYALALASGNAPGFLDWNNNYGDDRNMCINTHCSNFPKSFIGKTPEISNLDVIGASVGADKCFGAIKAQVVAGEMTFFRMSTDDRRGLIRSYVGEGEFTDDPNTIQGGSAVCRIDNLQPMLKYVAKNGFEHHVAQVRGHWADVLEEAITTYLDWDLYRHH